MIQPPNWQRDAVPTTRGWKHPNRREIILPRSFTQEQVDEYLNRNNPAPISLNESPPKKSIDDMTKRELAELAQHHGVDVKSSENKGSILSKVRGFLRG